MSFLGEKTLGIRMSPETGHRTMMGLYEHSNTISNNYTIGTGNNAVSSGTITIDGGVTVTVSSGSTWTVV